MSYGIGTFPGPLDADLQLLDDATRTDATASDTLDLGSGFAPKPDLPVRIIANVSAIKTTVGDEAYAFKVQERASTTDDWADTGARFTPTATGIVQAIARVTKRYIRLLPVISGTSPTITLSAWAKGV